LSSPNAWKGLHETGAGLLIVAGVLYLVDFALLIGIGNPPSDGALLLKSIAPQITFQVTIIIFFVIDAMLVPAVAALYVVLREVNGTYAMVGGVFALVALTVDLMNSVVSYSLIGLGSSYAAATSEASKAAYAATAEFVLGVSYNIGTRFFMILFSLAVLITSAVMLKGSFGRIVGYLGLAAGALGILGGIAGVIPLIVLWPVWFLAAGVKLYRLGRP
jgi:hypothetical protein